MTREIIYYEKVDGSCPVQEYLDSLKADIIKKIFFVFDLIEELDMVPAKFLTKLQNTDDIWEVRIEYNSNIYRFFGFMEKGSLVILTNGYQKKTQKTDKKQIELAEKCKRDYVERK